MGKLQDFLMSRADIGEELVEVPDCHPARSVPGTGYHRG